MAVIDDFLKEILKFLKTQQSFKLANYLRVEPEGLSDIFVKLCQELKTSYHNNEAIERKIETAIPLDDDDEGGVSASFHFFLQTWLQYWRDVDFTDLVQTHSLLTQLTNTCIQAFSHNRGLVCLATTIQICDALAKLCMTLDKRPDLTVNLQKVDDGEEGRKTIVETTAETIQKAFTVCLIVRTSSSTGVKDGKPEGKKVGIYLFANLVLKLLFKGRKTRLAYQLFTNISQNSPPLRLYSDRQRVTFLYYLGRFHFSNNHFYYAQACLQAAYDQCHSQFLSQKRLIIIYLIASNMLLGRLPSRILMMLPEAAGLSEKFDPIANAIRGGDMVAFKHALGPEHGNEQWFFQKGLLLVLSSRCEVLVWRSLVRRVFLLTYNFPWDPVNGEKFPTMDLNHLVTAAQYCQKRLEGWERPPPNPLFVSDSALVPPPQGRKSLGVLRGVIFQNKMPNLMDVEAIVASLRQQRLITGWVGGVDDVNEVFSIQGSKRAGGPLKAGFPPVWEAIKKRVGEDNEIPGWVQTQKQRGGNVITLTSARPVGT